MKKRKLKLLRLDLAAAKNLWQQAVKAKKKDDEIKGLRASFEAKLLLVAEAESNGKKDADEIDVPTDYKGVEGKDGKAAEDDEEGDGDEEEKGIVGLEQLTKMVSDTCGEQLDAKLKAAGLSTLDEKTVEGLVAKALKNHFGDEPKMPDRDDLKSIIGEIIDAGLKQAKKPSKMRFGQRDGKRAGEGGNQNGMIEMPYSLCKGNLPLHMKQLFNVIADGANRHKIGSKRIELLEIEADEENDGKALSDNFWMALRSMGTKALTTDGTATGAEWVPRDLSTELYRRTYLNSDIAQMMLAREVEMPSDPFDLPISTTRPTFYKNNVQGREAKGSTPGTGKFTLTSQKLMCMVQYSYEVSEDAIIAVLPLMQNLIGEAAAAALESAIINGDTGGTHQDSDITDPDAADTVFDGLRKLSLAVAGLKVDLSTGISRANLLSLKSKLGKWGRNPNDLAWICGTLTENRFLGLDEVVTVDKRGPGATTVTGRLNSYLGIPIVISEAAREDLNASGVYDGSTTTKGSLILANLSNFVLGNRREFMIETDRNIRSQTIDLVASFRKAFKPSETPSSTVKTVAIGYNYTA